MLAAGTAALLCCAPAMAQEPEAEVAAEADAAQEGPLGPDPAPDEVIEFFTPFSASERIGEALAPVFSEIMEQGAVREGWKESGMDILAELAAREGVRRPSLCATPTGQRT